MENRLLGNLLILITLVCFVYRLDAQSLPGNNPVRINAGGEEATIAGIVFEDGDNADYGNNGTSYATFAGEGKILNTSADEVFETEKHDVALEYSIPVIGNNCYSVHLHFAEIFWDVPDGLDGGIGSRIFDVLINGNPVLTDFDVIESTGASLAAIVQSFDVCLAPAENEIRLEFLASEDEAKISAIEIVPQGLAPFGGNNVFPVEYLAMEARLSGNAVQLDWTTASELNNDYFTVERSVDGIAFEALETIDGAGTSAVPLSYRAFDPSPASARMYYRIKQTDFDGTFSYSNMIELALEAEPLSIAAYPNPSQYEDIRLQVSGFEKAESLRITVLDMRGKVVFEKRTLAGEAGGLSLQIRPEASWVPGLYQIQVSGRTDVMAEKLLITR